MRSSIFCGAATHRVVALVTFISAGASGSLCQADTLRRAQTDRTAPPASNPAAGPWRLAIHVSGGFAGLDRQLELASTGELTASDRRRDSHVTARLTAEEIAQIGTLIPAAPATSPGPTGCADCLLYDVTLDVQGRSVVVRLDDITRGRSPIDPLIKSLLTLLDRALTGRLKPPGNKP